MYPTVCLQCSSQNEIASYVYYRKASTISINEKACPGELPAGKVPAEFSGEVSVSLKGDLSWNFANILGVIIVQ